MLVKKSRQTRDTQWIQTWKNYWYENMSTREGVHKEAQLVAVTKNHSIN